MLFTGIDPETLIDACGEDPGLACEKTLRWTDNSFLAEVVSWLVDRPLAILLIIIGAWIVRRLIGRALHKTVAEINDPNTKRRISKVTSKAPRSLLETGPPSLRAHARAETIADVLDSISAWVVYGVAAVMVFAELGVNIGPLVAGAGIIGVALGFGAQSLVKDFLSGMFMLVEDQFGVGDVIDVGEATGVVEAVSLRTTRLRDVQGTVWHVPNGEIARVGNMSQQWARALLDIEVAYDTDLAKAQQLIKEVADGLMSSEDWRDVLLEEPEVWGVENLGADGVAIRVVIKTQPGEQWKVARQLRLRLKERFDADGIEIPFPQRTMWVRRDPGSSRDGDDSDVATDDLAEVVDEE